MNLWELTKLSPKVIEEVSSDFNNKIKIVKTGSEVSILADGLTQSGPPVERIWRKFLTNFSFTPNKLLLLGVGAGSIFKVTKALWPKTKLIGIEIDPVMISIANKYFPDNLKKAEIIIDDAIKRVNILPSKFDIIIVDLYMGKKFPHRAISYEFLNNLKSKLDENGICFFNRLYFDGYKNEALNFYKITTRVFDDVKFEKNALLFPTNLIISAK